ncbi:MscL family protein [bacterium]|nr:MscL family protein [bacterium]
MEDVSLWTEFVTFLSTFNVIGVTIGLIIATKVAEVTKSLIEDLIMPLIFSPLLKKLKIEKLEDLSWRGVLYGKVLARLLDFVIVAFCIFLVVKYMNLSLA